MHPAVIVTVTIVSLLHIAFMVIEMFLWQKPAGKKIFGLSSDYAARSTSLAANQGLYNGFLAAGLIWGLYLVNDLKIVYFFLCCVAVAGIFGAITAKPVIFWMQSVPAIIAGASTYYFSQQGF
jgi:putative membrane protein